MGKVQQQFFPDSSRPEILVDLWFPEGTSFAANEEVTKRVERACAQARGRRPASPPGSAAACRASTCRSTRSSRRPTSRQSIVLPQGPEGARDAARAAAGAAGRGVPRGARPRQAAAQRPAGAVSGAVPRRRPRAAAACARYADEVKAIMRANPNMRGVNDNWNESVKVLRLEVDQDKARALGVTSQAHRAGVAHHHWRHHDRPVPRGRQADRHRAAPAARRAQRDHRPGQRLPADGHRASRSR